MALELTESSSTQPEAAVDMESLLQEQEGYVARPGEIRKGRVIQLTQDGALVDVGLKREGFVPMSDLRQVRKEMGEIHEGDEVFVKLLESESEGYIKASIYQARLEEDWIRAEEMMRSGALYEGRISSYNRGGLTVPFGRIRGFIPVSQVVGIPRGLKEAERRQRLAAMVGQTVGLRVVNVNREEKRLILSQRRAHRAWQRIQRKRLLDSLEVGQRRRGKVTSITDFGVFVDLGGVEGMVHVSELSWQRVEDPHQVVQVGDEVEVVVLEVNRRRERIALSIKQTQEDPWTRVGEKYRENQLVEGEVTRVTDIGAFVELEPGVEGLLHASELIGAPDVTPQQVLKPGETILLKVLEVNPSRRRIRLSTRRVRRDEWERWAAEKAARERAAEPSSEAEATAEPAPEAEVVVSEAEAEAPDEPAAVPEAEPVILADEG